MTQFDPSLIISRMRVEHNGTAAYDEPFHRGVNVIRGENSSGKSTILNFIFYALGGDLSDWSEAAQKCSRVLVEVTLSGKLTTLSRNVSATDVQPMDIFFGSMNDALKAPNASWMRFPYKRSSIESFSQTLFRLLGLPEASGEGSSNITMHQVLRLLYADQLSPVENLFRFENFDTANLRDAVGRLLCGAHDGQLYEKELRLRGLVRQYDELNAELRSLILVLGDETSGISLSWVTSERSRLATRKAELLKQIVDAEEHLFTSEAEDSLSLKMQSDAFSAVQGIQKSLGEARDRQAALEFEITDSDRYIASLERKLDALSDAALAAEFLVEVSFGTCPACLAQLESSDDKTHCALCKTAFDSDKLKGRIAGLVTDTGLQIRQSKSLQSYRQAELAKLKRDAAALTVSWRAASDRLADLRSRPSGELQEAVRALHRAAGYLDRELEDFERKVSLAMRVNDLSQQKERLNGEIGQLRADISTRRDAERTRLSRAYTRIADEVIDLLRHDLRRQDSFEDPNVVQFDFGQNKISVDGQTYFSASSRVVLKSAFFLAFLAAASKDASFRHPRFCIIDTVEDKGMEPQRSHNFQMQIARKSMEARCEHQVIYATAMIAPDLDDEQYVVGAFSTRDEPTLRFAGQGR